MVDALHVPDKPWMPAEEAKLLESLLDSATCFLEYGAGGSSILAGTKGVKYIFSVESDRNFLKAVATRLSQISRSTKIEKVYVNIGETERLGKPTGYEKVVNWPKYSSHVWSILKEKGQSPDLILIDGRFRISCFLCSLYFAEPGTVILFDDYYDREKYKAVERILLPEKRIGRMAKFLVPQKKDLFSIFLTVLSHVNDYS